MTLEAKSIFQGQQGLWFDLKADTVTNVKFAPKITVNVPATKVDHGWKNIDPKTETTLKTEIADQTIGDIDRGRRKAAQPYAESDPRRGPQKRVPTRIGFVGGKNNPAGVMRECKRRIAERAG